jgi:hypothetical protein
MGLAVSPANGARIVCYCTDCQAFARLLGRAGTTDAWGGTDVCKTAAANTGGARIPFVGLIHGFMDHEQVGCARDELLGNPLATSTLSPPRPRCQPLGATYRCGRPLLAP